MDRGRSAAVGARPAQRGALRARRIAWRWNASRLRPPDPRGPLATSLYATVSDEAGDQPANRRARSQDELRHSPEAETVVVSSGTILLEGSIHACRTHPVPLGHRICPTGEPSGRGGAPATSPPTPCAGWSSFRNDRQNLVSCPEFRRICPIVRWWFGPTGSSNRRPGSTVWIVAAWHGGHNWESKRFMSIDVAARTDGLFVSCR